MTFPADDQPPQIKKPGEQPFDLPVPAIAAQLAAVLVSPLAAAAPVWRDHPPLVLVEQLRIEQVTVVGPVTDQPLETARVSQAIEYTDFPITAIELWVGQSGDDWVLMLPGEF